MGLLVSMHLLEAYASGLAATWVEASNGSQVTGAGQGNME
jgi:hypothetical protein